MRVLTVPDGGPMRLDTFLARQVPGGSRRVAQRAIAEGGVRINGQRARKGASVSPGDVIQLPESLYVPPQLQPNSQLHVAVLYDDDELIAIDKPAGMPSHALRAEETDTAANFLLAHHPELAVVGKSPLEAGVVHRLDTDTSGVLLAARTVEAYDELRRQFTARQVGKDYVALVVGDIALPGELRTPIAHDQRHRHRMRVCADDEAAVRARPAVTVYRPIERFGDATLLAVQIPTGVMHQIRVHLASIGHAVVGDGLYGELPTRDAAPRQLLHAARLGVLHPATGHPIVITSPLPTDFVSEVERRRTQHVSARTAREARGSRPRKFRRAR